jgi:ABC-2 type transport system ATP-binding protein
MPMIEAIKLHKEYKILQREHGLLGAIKSFILPKYKRIDAIKNVSFSIQKGKIVGFIGPNGAGKSTTIKIMVGILSPTSGEIKINGLDPFKNRKEYAKSFGVGSSQNCVHCWYECPESDWSIRKAVNISISDIVYDETVRVIFKNP